MLFEMYRKYIGLAILRTSPIPVNIFKFVRLLQGTEIYKSVFHHQFLCTIPYRFFVLTRIISYCRPKILRTDRSVMILIVIIYKRTKSTVLQYFA